MMNVGAEQKDYNKFIITLVNEITSDVFAKLKYLLRDVIQGAILEKLQTPLDLFIELEQRLIVGPQNLKALRELLEMIQEPKLMSMLYNFASPCGISSSRVIAKPPLKNSLMMDGYSLQVKGGQHYHNESVGEYVELMSGSSYELIINNFNRHRCISTIKIDGHVVFVSSIICPFQTVTIDHPLQRNGKFTFFALDHAPQGSGINEWKNENGLVEVTFTPERNDMLIKYRVSNWKFCTYSHRYLTCSNETTDVGLHMMILSVYGFDKATAFSIHFGWKPIGQRNMKLTDYGIGHNSVVDVKLGLTGGGIHVPPSIIQHDNNNGTVGAPKWIPGATTLRGDNEHMFGESGESDGFVPDPANTSTLYLRLVGRIDDKPPASDDDEYTSLARETLIPPPVTN